MSDDLVKDLVCPVCSAPLVSDGSVLSCACGRNFPIKNNVPQMNVMEIELDEASERVGCAKTLLSLSYQLATNSAWMIPPMRKRARVDIRKRLNNPASPILSRLKREWNFEHTLQKEITTLVDKLVSPEELSVLFTLQWKDNLTRLANKNRDEQAEYKKNGEYPSRFAYQGPTEREEMIKKHLPNGGTLLYIGCGTGRECLRYEHLGYDVFGIDTEAGLVDVMSDWCQMLGKKTKIFQMNAMALGFKPGLFDAAVVEIYGSSPSFAQRLVMQSQLAKVLKLNGVVLVSVGRNRYTQYMQLQNLYRDYGAHPNVKKTAQLLIEQAPMQAEDEDNNNLRYGVAKNSYTPASLSQEMSSYFDVISCKRMQDLRYICAVGQPLSKPKRDMAPKKSASFETEKSTIEAAKQFAKWLEGLVGILKEHAENELIYMEELKALKEKHQEGSGELEDKAWTYLTEKA
ncbi:MAG: methyltransferase domain-containing protein [Candidatus Saganbacteria bacterium]|nr:methyltransferase domain-containing protein [Candidatus Saganbacteria bacterium]